MQQINSPVTYSRRANPYEIRDAIKLLEDNGYLVRRPGEANLPVVVEILPPDGRSYDLDVRVDATVDGRALCIKQRFPIELMLNSDRPEFMENEAPRILGRELGAYIGDGLADNIALAMKTRIAPLVPEKRMTLPEIESYLMHALADPMRRVERDDRA